MKKVIFCAAALVFTVMSYGQIPTPPNAPDQATPLPPSGPLANLGEALQTGTSQKLCVLQIGTANSALTTQDDGTGSGGNIAKIQQIGASGGNRNWSEINQKGTINQTFTDQRGDDNKVLVNQGQINTASSDNSAKVQQGPGGGQAEFNEAEVRQDGKNNLSFTKQTVDKNKALTKQDGDDNIAKIIQNGSPNMSDGQAAEVWQRGNNNQAQVNQLAGAGARNKATSIQLGNNNRSLQKQLNTAATLGTTNNAFVSQGDGPASVGNTSLMSLFNSIVANVDNTINMPLKINFYKNRESDVFIALLIFNCF